MSSQPIRLHPDNPHYFEFRGRPTILLSSAEHYGAVLNLDFDYVCYLDALGSKGFNYTRIFSGAYREVAGSFRIERNNLRPAPGRLICPWARSEQAGYVEGGNKFDLARWDEAYFARLKDFVSQAGGRGIVVEMSLFCPYYQRKEAPEQLWQASPLHAANNVNGVGDCSREDAYSLANTKLLAVQEAMVRKIVSELSGFDNLFYEIANEPYFGIGDDFQAHVTDAIAQAESPLPARHLIAQNIANHHKKVERPHPAVSILNFHYAFPPVTVEMNYGLGRVIGDDETGFRGSHAAPYRTEAWDFLIAGGGLYNNLDYGYTVARPDGTDVANDAPGSTTAEVREQLAVLREFINALDFIHMRPDNSVIKGWSWPAATARALVQPGAGYAVYVNAYKDPDRKAITPDSPSPAEAVKPAGPGRDGQAELVLDLPAGRYLAEWIDPASGAVRTAERFYHASGRRAFACPAFEVDIALRVLASGEE